MLSYGTIAPHTLELLKHLMANPMLDKCRLVGGTSLALQYDHRSALDLLGEKVSCRGLGGGKRKDCRRSEKI